MVLLGQRVRISLWFLWHCLLNWRAVRIMLLLIMFPCVGDWKESQFRMCISRIWQLRWSSQSLTDLHINVDACYVAVPVLYSASASSPKVLTSWVQDMHIESGHEHKRNHRPGVAPMPHSPPSYIYWPIDHGTLSCWAQMFFQNSCQRSAPDSDYQAIRMGWNETYLLLLLQAH